MSNTGDCYFVRNFLKHQKNLPLNPNNKAHIGIMKRFELYAYKFNIQNIDKFIEGASKGLQSPTGIGIGNSILKEDKIKRSDSNFKIFKEEKAFEFYKSQVEEARKYSDQGSVNYIHFANHVCAKNKDGTWQMKYFLQMDNQLTLAQFHKLYEKLGNDLDEIKSMADSIQVKVNYHGEYTDVYKTFNTWLNRKK